MTKKTLTLLPSLKSLKRGDILMFGANANPSFAQAVIMGWQAFFDQGRTHGHYDTTHVAIVVDGGQEGRGGKGNNNGPTIAHVTEEKVKKGYAKEPLWEMLNRDGGDRSFLVFRPTNAEFANSIASEAGAQEGKQIQWHFPSALKTIPGRKAARNHQPKIDSNSFCSKFIIQVIEKVVSANQEEHGLSYSPNISSSESPKTLESDLYQHTHYKVLCHPVRDPRLITKITIEDLLTTLLLENENETTKKKMEKYKKTFDETIKNLDKTDLDSLEKARELLQKMLSEFQSHGDLDLATTTSHMVFKNVRKDRIFERDFDLPSTTEKTNKRQTAQEITEKVTQPLGNPDSNPYEYVKGVILKELKRLEQYAQGQGYGIDKQKYLEADSFYHEVTNKYLPDEHDGSEKERKKREREKVLLLSRRVLIAFKRHRSWWGNWWGGHTRSTIAVLDAVKSLSNFKLSEGEVLLEDSMWNSEVRAPKAQPF